MLRAAGGVRTCTDGTSVLESSWEERSNWSQSSRNKQAGVAVFKLGVAR